MQQLQAAFADKEHGPGYGYQRAHPERCFTTATVLQLDATSASRVCLAKPCAAAAAWSAAYCISNLSMHWAAKQDLQSTPCKAMWSSSCSCMVNSMLHLLPERAPGCQTGSPDWAGSGCTPGPADLPVPWSTSQSPAQSGHSTPQHPRTGCAGQ